MVVAAHRDGGQAQFVEQPVLPEAGDDALGRALGWALEHLDEPLSIEQLAARAGMSPRTFARRFRAAHGTTPYRWLLTPAPAAGPAPAGDDRPPGRADRRARGLRDGGGAAGPLPPLGDDLAAGLPPPVRDGPALTRFVALTERLLNAASSLDRLAATVAELGELCADLTGFGRGDDAADQAESVLPSGRALSPSDAARCLADPLRTARFLRGVDAAIRARRQLMPDQPVQFLYTGTGPFAPLLVPLLPLYDPTALRVTLIDMHKRSAEIVRRLVHRLGLADRVRTVMAADATTYVHPPGRPPGIVIVEAMQRSLTRSRRSRSRGNSRHSSTWPAS